jgi:dethiobiotin synthetase
MKITVFRDDYCEGCQHPLTLEYCSLNHFLTSLSQEEKNELASLGWVKIEIEPKQAKKSKAHIDRKIRSREGVV